VLLLIPSAIFAGKDQSIWMGDSAWYGAGSLRLWHALGLNPARWLWLLLNDLHIRAPGVVWFGELFAPIGSVLGKVETGFLLSSIAWQSAALTLVYLAAFFAFQEISAAAAAALFAAGAPGFLWMSWHYFAEPMQLACVAGFFWLATAGSRLDRRKRAIVFCMLAALAMLAKITSPLYVAVPAALVLRSFARAEKGGSRQWSALEIAGVTASAVIALACVGWYAINLRAVLDFAVVSSSTLTGERATFFPKLWIWLNTVKTTLAPTLAWIFLPLLAGIAALKLKQGGGRWRWQRGDDLLAACLAQVALVLVVASSVVVDEWRYAYALLVPLSLAVAWVFARVPSRLRVVLGLLLAAQWVYAGVQARPRGVDGRSLSPPPLILRDEQIEALVSIACSGVEGDRPIFLGDASAFDEPRLSFYVQKRRPPLNNCKFAAMDDAESADRALARIGDVRARTFFSLNPELLKIESNGAQLIALLDRVRQEGATKQDVPGHPELLVYRLR
jgi:hypothetical protein